MDRRTFKFIMYKFLVDNLIIIIGARESLLIASEYYLA